MPDNKKMKSQLEADKRYRATTREARVTLRTYERANKELFDAINRLKADPEHREKLKQWVMNNF